MGKFMREHWIPACLSTEIVRDGAPLRLMLLGEQLIAFRDSCGRIGVLDHRCPHRCASLFFGRNEENGLRCVYHGWKFDVDGNCLDMPNVPLAQDFEARIRAHAYRATERSGIVYVYMGTRAVAPPLPGFEALLLPEDEIDIRARQRECNWLQALEGDIDTSHFGFLHAGSVKADDIDRANIDRFQVLEKAPDIRTHDTEWGAMYAAVRPADPGYLYYRFAHYIVPFWTLFPAGPFSHNVAGQAWVPMDDTHVMIITAHWKKRIRPLGVTKTGKPIPGLDRTFDPLPNTTDWFGRWRMPRNASNDYMIDRDLQRTSIFSGIEGVDYQDMAVTEGMGAISDRSLEHLSPSDRMISLVRRKMLGYVQDFERSGTLPAVLDKPELCRDARSGDFVAAANVDWLDAYAQNLAKAPRAAAFLHAAAD